MLLLLNAHREDHGLLLESLTFQGPCSAQHGGLMGSWEHLIPGDLKRSDLCYRQSGLKNTARHVFRVDWGAVPEQCVKTSGSWHQLSVNAQCYCWIVCCSY